jgi:choline dehydrogenase
MSSTRRMAKGVSRREFAKRSFQYAAGAALGGIGRSAPNQQFDYIVVGSGPGGGPLAVNLAKAGYKVALMEAGPSGNDVAGAISIPLLYGVVQTNPEVSWDFYVRRYANSAQQQKDPKYVGPPADGIQYPRASTIGGCGVHNLLVFLYPSNSDWDSIADANDDESWSSDNMWKYFQRLEACRYILPGSDPDSGHGFNGWQPSELMDPAIWTSDPQSLAIIKAGFKHMGSPTSFNDYVQNKLDFNDRDVVKNDQSGVFAPALTRMHGFRSGLREHILQTAAQLPNNLVIMTNTLVTRVLFDGRKAIGVEYMPGGSLYRASPLTPGGPDPAKQQLLCKAEVIIAGGTFNSPQLLKLSGVGPEDELRQFGIKTVVDLPGVGENLQDRYEISVISQLNNDLTLTKNCTFLNGNDPCLAQLVQQGGGYYSTIGSAVFGIRKSSPQQPDRDLVLIYSAAPFKGWYPGWQIPVLSTRNQFSWLILKAHTLNRAGTVKLRSADPRDTPVINFHFFSEGSDKANVDLDAVVSGIQQVRTINQDLQNVIAGEVFPGPTVKTTADITNFAQNQSWGHHASCSNKMGPKSDPMAVVDSNFRVRGVKNLRVVDASVFPRIPGYFVMLPIFMISEKASDAILSQKDED